MTDRRAGAWLAGLVLGAVSGLGLLVAGFIGLIILAAGVLLIAINGPRLLAGSGLVAGFGLVLTVLFARVALTCGGPLDPGVGTCVAGDLTAWIVGSAVIFAIGLVVSALAFPRTRR